MATQPNDKSLKILMSGGGSGGHITPLLAVAEQLKKRQSNVIVVTVGERGSAFAHLTADSPYIDRTLSIFAGKFRRYHGESSLRKLLDIRTNLLNLRDAMYVVLGVFQSLCLVRKERPDVVFLKGGFVGVPVGLAAAFWRIPIVTHDSDVLPGLANRIISRWAKVHATGMPAKFYAYPKDKVRYVGVLVGSQYRAVDTSTQAAFKRELTIPETARVLFITGGSLGAQKINQAVYSFADVLLQTYTDLHIVHQVGKGKLGTYQTYTHERLTVLEFVDGMYRYSGAADVIITRAGANALAEFGVQGKACIVVPSPILAGGHQLKNAEYLVAEQAALVIDEVSMDTNPQVLRAAIEDLLTNKLKAQNFADKLQGLAIPDAATRLAVILIGAVKQ